MKTFYDQVRHGLRRWSGAHPSAADWIALRDRQISVKQTRELEAHLKNCEHVPVRMPTPGLRRSCLFLKVDAISKRPTTSPRRGPGCDFKNRSEFGVRPRRRGFAR